MLLILDDSLGFHGVEDYSDGAHPRGLPRQGDARHAISNLKTSGL